MLSTSLTAKILLLPSALAMFSGFSASVPRLQGVGTSDCRATVPQQVADTPVLDQVSSNLSLAVDGPSTPLTLHSPVFASVHVSNRGTKPAWVDFGPDKQGNIEIAVQTPRGTLVRRTVDIEGFSAVGRTLVAPDNQATTSILLNKWYDFPSEGDYRVQIALVSSSHLGQARQVSSLPFTVHIAPRDEANLRQVANHYADDAISGPTLNTRIRAAEVLSYIRDDVATDALVRVLNSGTLTSTFAISALAKINTPSAIAALSAAQRSSEDPQIRLEASTALKSMQSETSMISKPRD